MLTVKTVFIEKGVLSSNKAEGSLLFTYRIITRLSV